MPLPNWNPTEKTWQAEVIKAATLGGWWHYHTFNSKRSVRGWPDLVLLRPPELVMAELKTLDGRVSDDQTRWLEALAACGVEVYVWRPLDLDEVYERLVNRTKTTVAK